MEEKYIKAVTKLKISDVRIRLVTKEDSKLKAVASMTIEDCFVVHDIKVSRSRRLLHRNALTQDKRWRV